MNYHWLFALLVQTVLILSKARRWARSRKPFTTWRSGITRAGAW